MKQTIALIVAASNPGNVIGNGPKMPWPQLKGDMESFRKLTIPHPIILGRKTAETFKRKGVQIALPDRQNIIVTRHEDTFCPEGAWTAPGLDLAIEMALHESDKAFICGGGEIYRLALGFEEDGTYLPKLCVVDEICLTEVDLDVQGDVFFPGVPPDFKLIESETVEHSETVKINGVPTVVKYRIKHFVRD